jgi:flagellar protein FlgJ
MKPLTPVPAQILTATSSSNAQERASSPGQDRHLRELCSQFEALFINQMLQIMRKSIPKSGLLAGGLQEDIYTGMFDERLAAQLSKGKGIGLAEQLYHQLARSHETARPQEEEHFQRDT